MKPRYARYCMAAVGLSVLLPILATAQDFSSAFYICTDRDFKDATTSVAVGDLDDDGDLDLIFGNGGHVPEHNLAYSNDGYASLYAVRHVGSWPDKTYEVVLGDLDSDGDLDLVVGNDYGDHNSIYFNDGKGFFSFPSRLGWRNTSGGREEPTRGLALGDMDGDGDLDIVVANRSGQNYVYLNQGDGTFPEHRTFGDEDDATIKVDVGDVDGDGDLDIVVANRGPNFVYFNDGTGGFDNVRSYGTGSDASVAVKLADVTGDGVLDIVLGNESQPNAVYVNDEGGFGEARYFGTGDEGTRSVAVGDVDGDGDLDIAVGNWGQDFHMVPVGSEGNEVIFVETTLEHPNRVYLNDGSGHFTAGPTFGLLGSRTRVVALADMNGDGHLDIIEGNTCSVNAIYLNNLIRSTENPRQP